jgi:hypothetical protein
MLGMNWQVKDEGMPVACPPSFVRDEEAAGWNPAIPTM